MHPKSLVISATQSLRESRGQSESRLGTGQNRQRREARVAQGKVQCEVPFGVELWSLYILDRS